MTTDKEEDKDAMAMAEIHARLLVIQANLTCIFEWAVLANQTTYAHFVVAKTMIDDAVRIATDNLLGKDKTCK